jgi:hypothetical protein
MNRNPKDLWTGVLFIAVGLAAIFFVRGHQMGTAMRMGPAYFPTILGLLQVLIGIAVMLRALVRPGLPLGQFAVAKIALVLGAIVLFGLLLRGLGLIVIVVLSAYASKNFRWPVALVLAVGIAICSSIIFVLLLGIPIPMIGTWIGG